MQSNPDQNQESQEPSAPQPVPEHHVREAINPRTGRRERVFVDLEAVYPDRRNPAHETSFEELRASSRGWMNKNWRKQKEPLQQISGNAVGVEPLMSKPTASSPLQDHTEPSSSNPAFNEPNEQSHSQEQASHEAKASKARRFKVHGETQTQTSKLCPPELCVCLLILITQ